MPKQIISVLDFWALFGKGKLYLIKKVHTKKIILARLHRRSNNMKESVHRIQRSLGKPECGVRAEPGDLVFKAWGKKYKLLKKIVTQKTAEERISGV